MKTTFLIFFSLVLNIFFLSYCKSTKNNVPSELHAINAYEKPISQDSIYKRVKSVLANENIDFKYDTVEFFYYHKNIVCAYLTTYDYNNKDTIRLKKKTVIIFPNNNLVYCSRCIINSSPFGNKVGVFHYISNTSNTILDIYNKDGKHENAISVNFLDKMAVSDNGIIAMYGNTFEEDGFYFNKSVAHLLFYNQKGVLIGSVKDIGHSSTGFFSTEGEIFIVYKTIMPPQGPILFYYPNGKLIGNFDISDWPYECALYEVSKFKKNIRLVRWMPEFKSKQKEYIIINFDGSLKKNSKWKPIVE